MARLTSCGASRTLAPQMGALALLALLMAALMGSSSAVLRRSPTYTYQSRTNLTQLWQLSLDSCAMWVGTNTNYCSAAAARLWIATAVCST